jgi:error-prone DNA polymerase
MDQIVAERERGSYHSLEDFHLRTRLEKQPVENLILAGAFDSFDCRKRQLLWQLGLLEKTCPGELPLRFSELKVSLPDFTELEEMKVDYEVQGLSTKYHPMQVFRKDISGDGLVKSSELAHVPSDALIRLAGYVIIRQKPPTAKGFAFITLEDEEGIANVVVRPDEYEKYRQILWLEPLIVVEGTVQKRDGILNIVARTLTPLRDEIGRQHNLPGLHRNYYR